MRSGMNPAINCRADLKIVPCGPRPILKGLESLSPGLTRLRLPWVDFNRFPTLKELKQTLYGTWLSALQPLQGWSEMKSTQGRRCYANPGLSDLNPVGVAEEPIFILHGVPPPRGMKSTFDHSY